MAHPLFRPNRISVHDTDDARLHHVAQMVERSQGKPVVVMSSGGVSDELVELFSGASSALFIHCRRDHPTPIIWSNIDEREQYRRMYSSFSRDLGIRTLHVYGRKLERAEVVGWRGCVALAEARLSQVAIGIRPESRMNVVLNVPMSYPGEVFYPQSYPW